MHVYLQSNFSAHSFATTRCPDHQCIMQRANHAVKYLSLIKYNDGKDYSIFLHNKEDSNSWPLDLYGERIVLTILAVSITLEWPNTQLIDVHVIPFHRFATFVPREICLLLPLKRSTVDLNHSTVFSKPNLFYNRDFYCYPHQLDWNPPILYRHQRLSIHLYFFC